MNNQIDLRVDFAFKWSFGSQSRIENLRSLLQEILRDELRFPLIELTILNPIREKETPAGKLAILDVLAQDSEGVIYHIEIQLVVYAEIPKRFLYYATRNYASQLNAGEDYEELNPVISIFFVDGVLFPKLKGHHHVFHMRETTQGAVFCDDLEIHLFELPKFRKTLKELEDGADQWLYLLCHSTEIDPDSVPTELSIPHLANVLEDLRNMALIDHERVLYEAREKQQRDESSRRSFYYRQRYEGQQEGRQEGRLEGRQEGRLEGRLEGRQEGLQEGRQVGIEEGKNQMLDQTRRKANLVNQILRRHLELGLGLPAVDELLECSEDALTQKLVQLTAASS